MKTPSIESTNNYSLFVAHKNQQPMSPAHVKRLAASIRDKGFWPSKPVVVYREGGKLYLIDGHHRVSAAEACGAFVYFTVVPKTESARIGFENHLVKKWSNLSFVKLYASGGNQNYQTVLQYAGAGIPLDVLAGLLVGHLNGRNVNEQVRDGSFKVKTTALVEKILHIFAKLEESAPEIKSKRYIEALAALFYVDQFDAETFVSKALINSRCIVKCASREQALEVIEEVYNFKSRAKCPLCFLAKETATKRNPFKATKGSK